MLDSQTFSLSQEVVTLPHLASTDMIVYLELLMKPGLPSSPAATIFEQIQVLRDRKPRTTYLCLSLKVKIRDPMSARGGEPVLRPWSMLEAWFGETRSVRSLDRWRRGSNSESLGFDSRDVDEDRLLDENFERKSRVPLLNCSRNRSMT
jgi:hypothetical protein